MLIWKSKEMQFLKIVFLFISLAAFFTKLYSELTTIINVRFYKIKSYM